MKKETALSGSVQEKNGKLYAVIGYGDPITKKRKYKWIGLNLTPDAKKSVVKAALRDAIAAFTEQYEKECRGILSPEDCPFLEFLQSGRITCLHTSSIGIYYFANEVTGSFRV